MRTYPKIETLFNRNDNFGVNVNEFRRPEYGIIDKWVLTEKIDGTNIRLYFEKGHGFDVGGRTDNANIPASLNRFLLSLGMRINDKVNDIMEMHGLETLTLFGEGYGPKIQSGGRYRNDPSFILFDIMVNDSVWLAENAVTNTAETLDIERVPVLHGSATLEDALYLVKGRYGDINNGPFKSVIAQDKTYQAEGVVAKTIIPLYDNRGERVMWKLKASDFK